MPKSRIAKIVSTSLLYMTDNIKYHDIIIFRTHIKNDEMPIYSHFPHRKRKASLS